MSREVITKTRVHGSNAGLVDAPVAMGSLNNTDGMSMPLTGSDFILVYNPPAGSAHTITEPSAECTHHRFLDTLIAGLSIPSPGYVFLNKQKAAGWSQGTEGMHLDASASGLKLVAFSDPTD